MEYIFGNKNLSKQNKQTLNSNFFITFNLKTVGFKARDKSCLNNAVTANKQNNFYPTSAVCSMGMIIP